MLEFTRAQGGDEPPVVPLHHLSTQQRRIVEIIDIFERATGEPCGTRFLARRLGLHHSTIQDHLSALHRKGWLKSKYGPASLRSRVD